MLCCSPILGRHGTGVVAGHVHRRPAEAGLLLELADHSVELGRLEVAELVDRREVHGDGDTAHASPRLIPVAASRRTNADTRGSRSSEAAVSSRRTSSAERDHTAGPYSARDHSGSSCR